MSQVIQQLMFEHPQYPARKVRRLAVQIGTLEGIARTSPVDHNLILMGAIRDLEAFHIEAAKQLTKPAVPNE